jgi:hypothetical protein
MDGPRLTVFVRDSSAPDVNRTTTPGEWRDEDWPIVRTQWRRLFLAAAHRLADEPGAAGVDALRYVSGVGTTVPVWWNDATGNIASDDGQSLVFDTAPLTDAIEIIGFPKVALRAAVDAPIADWTIRLEDVAPDGQAALVTGALMSGAQRDSRLSPTPLPRDSMVDLATPLHFTTWTFRPGHRVRVAVANAQYPMAWPTPWPMTMRLATNDRRSAVELPVIPAAAHPHAPHFATMGPHDAAPDARTTSPSDYPGAVVTHDVLAKTTAVDFVTHFAYTIGPRSIDDVEKEHYLTHDDRPADSRFQGDETHAFRLAGGRTVRVRTMIDLRADSVAFHVRITRQLYENARLARTRVWTEAIPRGIH